jgi:flagellar biosynthetic protein FliR
VSETEALVFARCAGFFFRAPGFSHPAVPAPLRAGLAFAVAPALALRAHSAAGGRAFVAALAAELLLGAAIGMAASMIYDGAYAGGRAIDDYVGIRASVPSASFVAPSGFGRLWSLAFAAAFFVFGAYRIALDALARSFDTLPPGVLVAAPGLSAFAVALPATLLESALLVAAPSIVTALVIQLALAGASRVVARLSTFVLAFPIVFVAAVLTSLVALPALIGAAANPRVDLTPLRAAR